MTDLFWPGDHRAGDLMSDSALLGALVLVENAWLATLVEHGIAPASAAADLSTLIRSGDPETLAAAAERDGNPVTALVALLRDRAEPDAARWLHRGLTSQDVLDSALMICLRDALAVIAGQLRAHVCSLVELTEKYRGAPMLTRTLTQPALPATAGARFAVWLSAVLDAADAVAMLPAPPAQLGGAAGTMAAATELAGSPVAALALADSAATGMGLTPARPWHTTRAPVTRAGDALVTCTGAWGHIANDVALGARAEIGEFAEGESGRSSTMPHKNNPVLAVLVRRAALTAPPLAMTLHAASAAGVDERADGGWHAEWATLRTLTRRTVVAGAQTADLLAGLRFAADRAAANLAAAGDLLAEQRVMAELTGRPTGSAYLGTTDLLVDDELQRAHRYLKGTS